MFQKFFEKLYFVNGIQDIEFSKNLIGFGDPHKSETSAEVHYVFVYQQQLVITFLGLTNTKNEVIATSSFDSQNNFESAFVKERSSFCHDKNSI